MNKTQEEYSLKINKLISEKVNQAKQWVSGIEISQEQLELYKAKERLARRNGDTYLSIEAEIAGGSVEELEPLIISASDYMSDKLDEKYSLIEGSRRYMNGLNEEEKYKELDSFLRLFYRIDRTVTLETIQNIQTQSKEVYNEEDFTDGIIDN